MSRVFAANLVLILPVVFAPAAPVPTHLMPKPVYYFPTEFGAKRTYESTNYIRGKALDPMEETTVVTAVEARGGEVLVSEAKMGGFMTRAKSTKTVVSGRGLDLLEADDKALSPPRCLLKAPYTPETEWIDGLPDSFAGCSLDKSETAYYRIIGVERVTVPAGTFDAVRVEAGSRERRNLWIGDFWYAPGVGLVKSREEIGLVDHTLAVVLKSVTRDIEDAKLMKIIRARRKR
jgi:hypothetical protein